MPNSFPFKNKIIVGHSICAFSFCFPKDKSNQQRTYICLFVFCFKMRENPLHFLTLISFLLCFHKNLLSVCSMCMVCEWSVPWSTHTTDSCCLLPPSAVAVCHCNHYQRCHCHQLVTAIVRIGDLLLLPPLCFSWDIQVKVPFTKA